MQENSSLTTAPLSDDYKDRFRPTAGWVVYDLANTIFSFLVVTALGAEYFKSVSGQDKFFGIASTTSMIAAGLLVPVLGAISDKTGRSKRWLIMFTIICCGATLGLGFVPTGSKTLAIAFLIILFALANFSFQSALVFYNSLLPEIAGEKRMGLVSGLGIGIGYFGNLVGGGLALLLVPMFGETADGKSVIWPMFPITAALFLLFALPCFLWVRERNVKNPAKLSLSLATGSFKELWKTLRSLPSNPVVLLFLIGNFFCMDALNTTIVCAARSLIVILGFATMEAMWVLLGFSGVALFVGLMLGKLIDIIGSWRVFFISCVSFIITLIACVLAPGPVIFIGAFIVFGPIGLAGIQSAGRKILVELAPPEKIGEYFGLFGLTNKVSALGVLAFFLITDSLGGNAFAYRVALAALLAFIIPGTICILIAQRLLKRDSTKS